jgi:hypothetical protein
MKPHSGGLHRSKTTQETLRFFPSHPHHPPLPVVYDCVGSRFYTPWSCQSASQMEEASTSITSSAAPGLEANSVDHSLFHSLIRDFNILFTAHFDA